ncbi:hypothetical protein ACQ4PT_058103 [Festuca glaucescens]
MHRDLKPENVLVDARGSLEDMRPGDVLQHDRWAALPQPRRDTRIPRSGYHPRGHGLRRAGRLVALGVMMAELLAGKHPFHGSSDADHLSEILDLLGTADIKEWSGYEGRRLPGGSQPESFLRIKFPPPGRPGSEARRHCRRLVSRS